MSSNMPWFGVGVPSFRLKTAASVTIPLTSDHELMDEDVIQIFASHKKRQERVETGKIKTLANNINAKNKTKGKGDKKKKK